MFGASSFAGFEVIPNATKYPDAFLYKQLPSDQMDTAGQDGPRYVKVLGALICSENSSTPFKEYECALSSEVENKKFKEIYEALTVPENNIENNSSKRKVAGKLACTKKRTPEEFNCTFSTQNVNLNVNSTSRSDDDND